MFKKYKDFKLSLNEEVGVRNSRKIFKKYKESEIYFHQDLDGICSFFAMKDYLERNLVKVVDAHIIQYGGIEYSIKNTKPGRMPVLVDFAHSSPRYVIATDHHSGQSGVDDRTSSYFKPSRSNVETISGEISPSDVFVSTDIELIRTIDSADFLKYNITPDDIENSIFSYNRDLTPTRNRFLMGFIVNRLLLSFKNKRISVTSLDGKRNHINRNFLECLAMDASPSLYSMFNNIKHYINNAISLEWDMSSKSHHKPKKLLNPKELTDNLMKYIETRKRVILDKDGNVVGKHPDIDYDDDYKIIKQYGIGYVIPNGSYDRYVVFKNNPEAEIVCTIFPMGLIQVSCNPFIEKKLKGVDLGAISKEVLGKFKYQFSNINIPVTDIKRISEDEIKKMKNRYGSDYTGIGFTLTDLMAFYKNSIISLPNRKSGDMKTRTILNLEDDNNNDVKLIKKWMDVPYESWPYNIRREIENFKIPIWTIIEQNSGGHPSITNISGLNYLSCRKDLLNILFKTDDYTKVMKLIADEFIKVLKQKIDLSRQGRNVTYNDKDVELKATISLE